MVKEYTECTGLLQVKSVRDSRRTRKDVESTLKPQIESKSYKHTINKAQGYESKTTDPVLSLHGVVCATESSIKTNTNDKGVQGYETKTNNSTPISTGTTESVKQTETSLSVVTKSSVTHTIISTSSPSVTELIPISLQPQMQSLTQPSLQPSQPLLQPKSQPNSRTGRKRVCDRSRNRICDRSRNQVCNHSHNRLCNYSRNHPCNKTCNNNYNIKQVFLVRINHKHRKM